MITPRESLRDRILRNIGSGAPRRVVAAKVLAEVRDVTASMFIHAELDEMVNRGLLNEGDANTYDWLSVTSRAS